MENDEKYMRLAIELAEKAKGRTSPNPMVGAVIVKNEEIVGRGYHQKAGTPHAEVHAIKDAGEKAKDATIYVSLEPCSHYGKTPPCTQAIINAGLSRVVMAMTDPNPRVNGSGRKILESHGIEVTSGILEEEAFKLNEFFIKYITTKLPFVILKTAMTLDGKIATYSGKSKWITSEESRIKVHQIRNEVDAILVGIGTVIKDDPSLTTRIPDGRDAIRIILDSHAKIPLNAKVLNLKSDAKTIVIVTPSAPEGKIDQIRQKAEVIIIPEKDGRINIYELMKKLGEMEITSVMIEGGAEVNASALKAGIVDRVVFFIAPKIFGGKDAPSSVGGDGVDDPSEAIKLKDMSIEQIGEDILVTGIPCYM
ncbi:TPA: bifunctional diaminohydroxyphosphoribosylaminopyrimidine deaminase/5-amino-6-(5-phosphoribosylamino)uracil reductase RibD [bacterium]|nr:bifunctional diaminohydroxyphosphoribosylaminopyrimidine deaminase/5-amino-6-(5-phosphoribosylamino)uracil reductase RibD [bacterium]